jgi:predicted nuclease of restriction endonuclease-like (RecB) superfamily
MTNKGKASGKARQLKKSDPNASPIKKRQAKSDSIDAAYQNIARILEEARATAIRAVNTAMVQAYWNIGRIIVEEEQKGKQRAGYGETLLASLSERLMKNFGKGFTERNLRNMRQFYLAFSIRHAVRAELSWTHYRLLLKVEKEDARNFYLNEAINSNWSTRELERQINSLLYERLLLSKDKKKALELSTKGQIIETPEDLIKDPYVLEFLNLKENRALLEKDLESALIDKLQEFLLELGRGFAFVARQRRITIDSEHFYIDLVFYNYILKCFVLIDLKIGKLSHADIGQMDFYVRYVEKEVRAASDNPTIGLILCSDKSEAMVKYTLLEESRQIFASKYQLYFPTEEELQRELRRERAKIELEMRLLNGR